MTGAEAQFLKISYLANKKLGKVMKRNFSETIFDPCQPDSYMVNCFMECIFKVNFGFVSWILNLHQFWSRSYSIQFTDAAVDYCHEVGLAEKIIDCRNRKTVKDCSNKHSYKMMCHFC